MNYYCIPVPMNSSNLKQNFTDNEFIKYFLRFIKILCPYFMQAYIYKEGIQV